MSPRPRPPCPLCGADNALRLCREQVYHPPRWLGWLAVVLHEVVTRTYTCDHCGATTDIGAVRARRARRARAR